MYYFVRPSYLFDANTIMKEWPSGLRENLTEFLSRVQLLLGLVLPQTIVPSQPAQTKPSSLLQLGLPNVDAQLQPALELVKPSTRFGLLLIGSSVAG
jgi:conserved oligomeric Golgi complex subunit 1